MTVHLLDKDPHDLRLISAVRPPRWVNPTPAERYHLVVIGAGTAGLVTAAGAAGLGAKVALIERELMGGDCLNVGCVPSKGVISAARIAGTLKRAAEFGIGVPDGVQIDFAAVMERMRRLRSDIAPNDGAERFRGLGVDVFLGAAKFTGPETVEVGGQALRFRKAVVATGARAHRPDYPGLNEAGYLTNESVFALTELPRRLAVIGGGPIGCELAQAFARLGTTVTLIERSAQILGKEDRDAAERVTAALVRDGLQIRVDTQIVRVERAGNVKRLHLSQAGQGATLDVDEILVGAGRVPNVDGLNLPLVGVNFDAREGVHVNDRLQTSNPRIYAAGDICSKYKFTHAADFMARIVIQNALFRGSSRASSLVIPWCTYTSPEIAHVGLTERDAEERKIPIQTFRQEFSHVDRAILEGETEGFVKVHVKAGTDQILGATIVAEHAGEMIGELTLAIKAGIGLKTIGATIHPYPTVAEAIRKLGDQYNRTRLTPFVAGLLRRWLQWTL